MSGSGDQQSVLLLQPRIGYMDSLRSAPSMPLGLLHAASLAVESFKISIFDQRLSADWRRDLAGIIERENPIAIGASMYIGPPTANALEMLGFVADKSGAHRFVGGVLPSLDPEICVGDSLCRIDSAVIGEGELALKLLLERLAAGESLNGVQGVCFKEGEAIIRNALPSLLDLDSLPEIPYRLVMADSYFPEYKGRRTFYMETSRGCPSRCGYCYNSVFNRGVWRAQSAGKVRERLELAKREFGANSVYFVDDNFFVRKERGLEIASTMMELDMDWQLQGVDIQTLKRLTREELSFLKTSGLVRISVGVESGSERVRRFLGKNFSNDDVYEVVNKLKEFGFLVFCSFMCDMPSETDSEIRESVGMALRLTKMNPKCRVSPFYRYVPSPGTRVYEMAVGVGLVAQKDIQTWGGVSFDGHAIDGEEEGLGFTFQKLHMATLFCDSKSREYTSSRLFRALAALYRPVARFRLKNMFFKLMPESRAFVRFLQRASRRASADNADSSDSGFSPAGRCLPRV